jgi:hypothetical protein
MCVEHARLGQVTLPGTPLRFFDTQGRETTKNHHTAPPVLDADGATIRQWLAVTLNLMNQPHTTTMAR